MVIIMVVCFGLRSVIHYVLCIMHHALCIMYYCLFVVVVVVVVVVVAVTVVVVVIIIVYWYFWTKVFNSHNFKSLSRATFFTSTCPLKVQISQGLGQVVQNELLKTGRVASPHPAG